MSLDLKSTDLNRFKFTEENVVKLKGAFPHLDHETLARYLIAQNNDLEGATKKLLKAEELKVDYWHIKKSQCVEEIKTGTAYLNGFDREGRPVLVLLARLHDPEKRNLKEMIQMTLWWTEQALAKLPDHKSQFVILLDRDNCENALDTEYLQKVAEIFQDLHPERLHKAIVYPTGLVYYSMWNLVLKWFMEEHTRSKVVPAITLSDVFDLVEEKYVPVSLGGKCTYQFNIDDYSDPIYPEDLKNSPSDTTLESLYSVGEGKSDFQTLPPRDTEPMHSPDRTLTAQFSNSTHTTTETPLPDAQSVDTMMRDGVAIRAQSHENLLEFVLDVPHHKETTMPATTYTTPQKSVDRSIESQLAVLRSETAPLDGVEELVGEGWQEYLEYERSQHNSPTGPYSNPHVNELFSPDTVYVESSDEEGEENVWNDVDSVTSRLSFCSTQAPTLKTQMQGARTQPLVSSSMPVSVIHYTPIVERSVEFSVKPAGNHNGSGESYHYNANPAGAKTELFPSFATANVTSMQLSTAEEEDDCAGLWHEVASVTGSEDPEEAPPLSPLSPTSPVSAARTRGSSATSRHPFEASVRPQQVLGQSSESRTLHRSKSSPALLGSPKIHPTVAAYARIGTFVVFASVGVVMLVSLFLGIYAPSLMAPEVPLTVLAQLVLLLMLLFSFL